MSKIRLHGSSSGHTEVAPAAAAGNNTVTLPNSAGTLLLTDGSAASLTQIPAANIVGVATGGFKKSGESSLQVLEQFYLLCDGRSVSTTNGTLTTENVSSEEVLTDVYAVMDGSTITYQPPAGTTDVIYEYRTVVSETGSNNRLLYSWYLAIDGTQITQSRDTYMNATGGYIHDLWVKHAFKVNTGGSDSSTTGDRSGLPSMELKVLARRWNNTYPATAHYVTYFTPSSTANIVKAPFVGITAIGQLS